MTEGRDIISVMDISFDVLYRNDSYGSTEGGGLACVTDLVNLVNFLLALAISRWEVDVNREAFRRESTPAGCRRLLRAPVCGWYLLGNETLGVTVIGLYQRDGIS